MVFTGKGRLRPKIWPKTPQQAESTENMMKTTWNAEAMQQQKSRGKSDCLLPPTGKEERHVHP